MVNLDVFGLIKTVKTLEQKVSVGLLYSGLRVPQFLALDYIDSATDVTVTDISQRFGTTRATASQLVNELIAMDAIATAENPADRRSFFLRLTLAGSNKLAVGRRDVGLVLENISSKYADETIEVLNEFSRNLKQGRKN